MKCSLSYKATILSLWKTEIIEYSFKIISQYFFNNFYRNISNFSQKFDLSPRYHTANQLMQETFKTKIVLLIPKVGKLKRWLCEGWMLPCLLREVTSFRARHVFLICIRPFCLKSPFLKRNKINFGRTSVTRKIMSSNEDNSVIDTLRSSVKEQVFIKKWSHCLNNS